MADRFIIHGAAFNGDGTTSAEAASNGGVGAWNTITYFEGTTPAYGTLPAGTTVYIRSKDAAGADITIAKTLATTLGSAAATLTAPVYWVFDAGASWSGVSGVITYSFSTQVACTTRDHNHIICAPSYNFVITNTMAAFGATQFCVIGKASTQNLKIDCSACSTFHGPFHLFADGIHESMWIRSAARHLVLVKCASSGALNNTVFYNPKIELLLPTELDPVFDTSGYFNSAPLTVFGGEVFGAGAVEGVVLVKNQVNTGGFRAYGLKYPRVIALSSAAQTTTQAEAYVNGADGILGNAYWGYYYAYDSRDDGYYPTLNASLETSTGDNWSYKVYPYRTNPTLPAQIVTSKIWSQAAAAKTVTLEILWPDAMASPTSDKVWMTVQYTDDASGLKKVQSTRNMQGVTLATSSALWSASTYGPTLFDKHKLQITTATSIKQDTEVVIAFFSIPTAASANDVVFVDPDPSIA